MPAPSDLREPNTPLSLFQLPPFPGFPDANRLLNYLHKYPADEGKKELDPDSRTWKVYLDEHESYDYDMVKGFRDNIDALLVLATLFSSVVTGFVVPAVERLEPDNVQINTNILFEVAQLLRANGNATMIAETPHSKLRPDSTTHSTADVCVAWMLFASLTLSLVTALASILAKQWLQSFTALVPGDAKRRSLTRQFRFAGMQKWKFAEIVGFLPLLLHLSLFLFLLGLCVYVERYHWSFLTMLGFVTLAAAVFYVVTAALPAVYLDCPYRIPILFIPASACIYAGKQLRYYIVDIWSSIQKHLKSLLFSSSTPQTVIPRIHQGISRPSTTASVTNGQEETGRGATSSVPAQSSPHDLVSQRFFTSSSLYTKEHKYIESNAHSLEFSSLGWLYEQTTNTSVQRIALHALGRALEHHASSCHPEEEHALPLPSPVLKKMRSFALTIIDSVSGPGRIADDIPQLLDFHIHSSHALNCKKEFLASRWPSIIESPHLLSFTERDLLPLNDTFSVRDRTEYPLHIACRYERWDFVDKYFRTFDDSQWMEADSEGWLSLGRAVMSDTISIELWGAIIWLKTNVTLTVNGYGETALHLICPNGATLARIKKIPEFMLVRFLNIQRRDGQTPLHLLCNKADNPSQRLEIAKYLLSAGADLGIVNSRQWTPLHIACRESHSAEFIETLLSHLQSLENGRDILNQHDEDGRTALHGASFFGKLDSQSVQALISASADPNTVDNNHDLPLHSACDSLSSPRLDIIAILLDHTNDINARNKHDRTPLNVLMSHESVSKNWKDAHQLMREKGAKLASELGPVEVE